MPHQIVYSMQDSDGESSKVSFYVSEAMDAASIVTLALTIGNHIDTLSDAIITGVNLIQAIDFAAEGWKLAHSGQTDKLVGGRFIFTDAVGNARAQLTIPSFKNASFVPNGSEFIDTSNPAISAFLTSFLGGITTNASGIEVIRLSKAYEVFGGKK